MNGSMNEDYPYHNNDTLRVFMNNHENINNPVAAIVPNVHFWEETPLNFNFKDMVSDPFYISINDSIVFSKYNVSAASPQFTDNCSVDLGNTAPYNYIFFKNNRYGENTIYGSCASYGEINERREMDNHFSLYEIRKEDQVLANGILSDFMSPFSVTEPGVYTFSVTNNNYKLGAQLGSSAIESTFDLSKTDANSPVFSSFKLLNADNLIRNTFSSDESGKLLFSAFDWDFSTYQMNTPAFVQSFYKKYDETDWTEFNVTEHPNLFDSVSYGSFYTCDLTPAFSQFLISGYLDIKIVAFDSTGNSTTHTWHPVAYVENTVGIQQVIQTGNHTLQIYPNPVKDNCLITFDLTEHTNAKLFVYNINGQIINTLLDKKMDKGNHQINWNTTNYSGEKLSPGIYLLKLETENTVETTKVIVQ